MKRFDNILYVFEPSVAQDTNIARAISLAQNNQARLTFMDVVADQTGEIDIPPGALGSIDLTAARIAERRQILESQIAPHAPPSDFSIEIVFGTKFLEVIRAVLRKQHDLVIKTAENPEWIERLFGSDDMHLLRKCPCPIWLMKPQEKVKYECIVAAIDFNTNNSDHTEKALNRNILGLASSLALSDFAGLHIAHAWDAPEAGFARLWTDNPDLAEANITEGARARHRTGLDAQVRILREDIGEDAFKYLSPQVHMTKGSARKAIPELIDDLKADLVVMGTLARTGIPGFIIGNTAEAILDQLRCSVLAIKPSGFVSPVARH